MGTIDNIEYLREFIGEEWIKNEIDKIEKKSVLKEVGSKYSNYHPFVQYNYEILYLLRRATALKQDSILMAENWSKLNTAGYLLKLQSNKIVDELDFKKRLRSAEQFDDTIWELEVATILKKNNIEYNFKKPIKGDSNDIKCYIDSKPLEIECKNKHIIDDEYNKNSIFIQKLCNKLNEVKQLKGEIIEIEFKNGNVGDIKTIVNEMKDNLKDNNSINVLNKYTISYKSKYKKMTFDKILSEDKVQAFYLIGEQSKRDIYTKDIQINENTIGVVFKFPNENKNLNNLSSLIKSANKQLPNGGVVFLKAPYDDFENIVVEIEKILAKDFSKIICIKVISFKSEYLENQGVKILRKEKLVMGNFKTSNLSKKEYDFLNKDIAFSIYR